MACRWPFRRVRKFSKASVVSSPIVAGCSSICPMCWNPNGADIRTPFPGIPLGRSGPLVRESDSSSASTGDDARDDRVAEVFAFRPRPNKNRPFVVSDSAGIADASLVNDRQDTSLALLMDAWERVELSCEELVKMLFGRLEKIELRFV
jgi:hypothetical protein